MEGIARVIQAIKYIDMIDQVKNSWSMEHKHMIITLSLATALVWQGLGLGQYLPQAEAVVVVQAPCVSLECLIEDRAEVIFNENEWLYREMARTDAMEETGHEVIRMMYVVK